MSGRDDILSAVRQRMRGGETHPGSWQSRHSFEDPLERFTEALTFVGGEVLRADSLVGAWEHLADVLRACGARRVVLNDEPPASELDLTARWPDVEWHVVGRTPGDVRGFCASADVGVSGVDAALADTGSVVVSSGAGKSRLATLLPPVHVALVPTSRLTTDIIAWAAGREGILPSNLIVITGPSKTADIEQILTIGVHGPKRLIAIVYDA